MRKKWTVVIGSFIAMACSHAPQSQWKDNQITMDRPVIHSLDQVDPSLKKLQKSLVRLSVFHSGVHGAQVSYGTGFFFGSRDLLITSNHLFDEKHECVVQKKCKIEMGRVVNSKEVDPSLEAVEVVLQDPAKDLIFLKVKNSEKLADIIPIQEKAPTHLSDADQNDLTAAGFFQDQPALTFSKGKKLQAPEGKNNTVLTNIIVSAGFSGSPIVNKKGQLVGVVSSFRPLQGQPIGLAQYNLSHNQNEPF